MPDSKAPTAQFLSDAELDKMKALKKGEMLLFLGGGGFVTGKVSSYDAANITLACRNARHAELIVNRDKVCAYAVYPA